MSVNITKDKVVELIYKKGFKPLDFEFNGYLDKVRFYDDNGYKYCINWETFKRTKNFSPFYTLNAFALENIKTYIKNNNIPVELLSNNFINSTTHMKFKDVNGHIFNSTWNNIYNRQRYLCPECVKIKRGIMSRLSYEKYEEMFSKHNLTIIDKSQIETTDKLIDVIDEFGYKGKINYSNLSQRPNTTFDRFSKFNPYTIENIKHYIDINNLDIKLNSHEYVNCEEPLEFICKCGNKMYRSWDSIKSNKGLSCSKCHKSNLEKIVLNYLETINVNFQEEYVFENCKNIRPCPFDFYLIDYNSCIEVQGEQHYKPITFGNLSKKEAKENYKKQIIRDKIKEQFCKNNNINLLCLKYTDIKNGRYKEIINNFINN